MVNGTEGEVVKVNNPEQQSSGGTVDGFTWGYGWTVCNRPNHMLKPWPHPTSMSLFEDRAFKVEITVK